MRLFTGVPSLCHVMTVVKWRVVFRRILVYGSPVYCLQGGTPPPRGVPRSSLSPLIRRADEGSYYPSVPPSLPRDLQNLHCGRPGVHEVCPKSCRVVDRVPPSGKTVYPPRSNPYLNRRGPTMFVVTHTLLHPVSGLNSHSLLFPPLIHDSY